MTRIPDLPSSGIPRIEVPRLGGGTVNLSCFTGHKLVILYCPANLDAASLALERFAEFAGQFVDQDAWLVALCSDAPTRLPTRNCPPIGLDSGIAWHVLSELAGAELGIDQRRGATFLFGRGGALTRVWDGPADPSEFLD